jgi:hypothetical protein
VVKVIGIYLSAAAALVATGVAIGIIAVVSLGIRREDRPGDFPADIDGRVARGARRFTGLHARGPGLAYQLAATSAASDPRR